MTTIGIMTMQRILNYGSSLQAYALHTLLKELAPRADIRYLDYRPGEPLVRDNTQEDPRNRIARALRKAREYAAADARWPDVFRFINHKRTYAKKYFPMIQLPSTTNYNLNIDLQVIGSDEVFNCVQSNANVGYSRDLFGIASPSRRIISYAASFGNTTTAKIRAFGLENELSAAFARFSHISVRDANSAKIIHELTGTTPPIHLDPTLVVDLLSVAKSPKTELTEEPYLLVYAYPGRLSREENDHIRTYANQRQLKVLCFGGVQSCGDLFVDCDPFELLGYFQRAAAVVTDTFHGSIFSVLGQRPFATITRHSQHHGYGNLEKIGYLLDVLGLRQRELSSIQNLQSVLEAKIDYESVQRRISVERLRTREYLVSAVESINESKPV
ncbi:polysaccharide pyruvyl transferase family protein [Glutamicibacter creatinolyticus]|uniref:polysaccharide pyruvyl transferase family protein n=1 Tax=Glutamicibacter creatinolyticus TaxID=162496 RepID=UPI0031CEE4A2